MGKNVIISTLPNISQNYLPKVNTSNIFANSLVYDDGSSVLINTTTASAYKLDVNGTGRFQGALTGTSATFSSTISLADDFTLNSANPQIKWASGNLRFTSVAGGTDRMVLTSAGAATFSSSVTAGGATISGSSNSGSGSVFPRLQVENTLATQGDGTSTFNFADVRIASGNSAVQMFLATTYAAGTWAPAGIINVATNHDLQIKTNNTTRLTISSTGAATFSTSVTSTINGVNACSAYGFTSYEGSTPTGKSINFSLAYFNSVDAIYQSSGNTNDFGIWTNGGTATQAKFYIKNGGNVGIGTTSPNYQLQVNSSTSISRIQLTNTSTGTASGDGFQIQADGVNGILSLPEIGYLRFETSDIERMRITSGGMVNINNTGNTTHRLYVSGNIYSTDTVFGRNLQGVDWASVSAGSPSATTVPAGYSTMTFSIGCDNTWRTILSQINDTKAYFWAVGGDQASQNLGTWSFQMTSPAYGVANFVNVHYMSGGWNAGSIDFQYVNQGNGVYGLQVKATSYYSSSNVATGRIYFLRLG